MTRRSPRAVAAATALVMAMAATITLSSSPARAARLPTVSRIAADATDAAAANAAPSPGGLPVVLLHGMGDSCCALGSIGGVAKFIESRLGVFVHSIATGEGELRDVASSFYGNVNDQVADMCRQLKALPDELANGFHMVGFSQGGQFLRAVVQRCGHELPGPVHTLVTLGGQHQGVSNSPVCARAAGGAAQQACAAVQAALAAGAYSAWVREHIVQAQYFKDPSSYETYLERNVFLPDINNEVEGERNGLYVKNLGGLEKLVLLRFRDDSVVEPAESSLFGFWEVDEDDDDAEERKAEGRRIVPMCESRLYREDWLGLRALDERNGVENGVCGGGGGGGDDSTAGPRGNGGLVFDTVPGDHMQFSMKWFEEEVMDRWLAAAPEEGWLARAREAQREAQAVAEEARPEAGRGGMAGAREREVRGGAASARPAR
jgi:palmitoyl-protein thioesterase